MNAVAPVPPGTLRDQQREASRAHIRKAARTCFLRDGVGDVTMEAVAAEAGIRRATLYLYYPGKNALLLDLLEQSLRATDRIYLRLRDLPRLDLAAVRGWLAYYLREVEAHAGAVDLFRSAILPDEKLRQLLREHNERTIELLAPRYACFDLSGLTGAERERRRFRAETLLSTIEKFCSEARLADYHLDREIGLDVLSEKLLAELAEG